MYLPDGPSFKIINTEVTLCNLMHIFSYLDNNKHRHAQTWNKYLWLEGKARLSNWDIIAALCSLTLIVNICNQFLWQKLKKNPDKLFFELYIFRGHQKTMSSQNRTINPLPPLVVFFINQDQFSNLSLGVAVWRLVAEFQALAMIFTANVLFQRHSLKGFIAD